MKGTLKNGFEFTISSEALDDWELVENLRKIDKGHMGLVVDVLESLLGLEQYEALKNHMRKIDGRVSAEKMISIVEEIFNYEELEGDSETKN